LFHCSSLKVPISVNVPGYGPVALPWTEKVPPVVDGTLKQLPGLAFVWPEPLSSSPVNGVDANADLIGIIATASATNVAIKVDIVTLPFPWDLSHGET
jgi:hypothetical protein